MQAPSLTPYLDPSIDAGLVTSLERQHLAAHKVGGVMAPAQTLIRGRVLDASRDAVAERSDQTKPRDGGYVAHVALERTSMLTEGGPVELGLGMGVSAEIKTGRRQVISYLLSPIARYRHENLRDR